MEILYALMASAIKPMTVRLRQNIGANGRMFPKPETYNAELVGVSVSCR